MAELFTIHILILSVFVRLSLTECNLKDGHCVYDMQLGQEGKCDSISHGSGVHMSGSCTCDDVSRVNTRLNALKYNEANLQQLMAELQQHMDNLTSEFNSTDSKLQTENQKSVQLKNTLQAKESMLNQTKDELNNILKSATSEISSLREKLGNNTRDLSVCQTSLGIPVTTNSALHSEYSTFYCDFENANICHFTQDGNDDGDWTRKNQQVSTSTGPKTDHTYGNHYGYYMLLEATSPSSSSSSSTTTVRMTSSSFNPAPNYCVRFWYTMYGNDVKNLNVYAKVNGGFGYPVFTRSGNVDNQWHMAELSLNQEYTGAAFQIVFEATHNAYHVYQHSSSLGYHYVNYNENGNIAVDDVYIYNTTCSSIPNYPLGTVNKFNSKTTSYYTFHGEKLSWFDAEKVCREENIHSSLATVKDAATQQFLVNIIQSDVGLTAAGQNGFYLNGNDYDTEGHYTWTVSGYPEPINYTNWHPGQPNNVGDNQDCMLMEYPESNYEWGDVDCVEKHPFICETVL